MKTYFEDKCPNCGSDDFRFLEARESHRRCERCNFVWDIYDCLLEENKA